MSKGKARPKGNALVRYLRDTRAELRNVSWPSRREAFSLTRMVLLVTIVMAAFLGALDYLFTWELRQIIDGNWVAITIALVALVASIVVAVLISRQTEQQ